MSSLPSMILFVNGDISYPSTSTVNFPGTDPKASELTTLQKQLFIDDTMTKAEFDARVAADPNYPTIVHLRGLRILVILPSFQDGYNRQFADVVGFLHGGLIDIECNRLRHDDDDDDNENDHDNDIDDLVHTFPPPVPIPFPKQHHHGKAMGPPGQSYEVQRITMYELLRAAGSHSVVILPWGVGMGHCGDCNSFFFCDCCHSFSGIRKCHKCGGCCKCKCDVGLIDNQGIRSSTIHLPSCENEQHNHAFIHRK